MNDKIAVCFYGDTRCFEYSYPLSTFSFEHDVYVSTWDYTYDLRELMPVSFDKILFDYKRPFGLVDLSKETDIEVLDGYAFKRDISSDYINNIVSTKDIKITNNLYRSTENTTNMIYHWKECMRMIEESGEIFKGVLFVRIDGIGIFPKEEMDKIIKVKNTLLSFTSTDRLYDNYFTDISFYGSFEFIKKVINEMPCSLSITHSHLGYYFKTQNFKHDNFCSHGEVNLILPRTSVIPILKKMISMNFDFNIHYKYNEDVYKKLYIQFEKQNMGSFQPHEILNNDKKVDFELERLTNSLSKTVRKKMI